MKMSKLCPKSALSQPDVAMIQFGSPTFVHSISCVVVIDSKVDGELVPERNYDPR